MPLYDYGADLMEQAQTEDAMESLTDNINQVYSLVDQPLETIIWAEDKLRTCFNISYRTANSRQTQRRIEEFLINK